MSENLMYYYIPGFFRNTKFFKALIDACPKQFDKVEDLINECIDQLYVDTATWGLSFWENDYELAFNPDLTIEQRRSRVKAKIRGIGKVNGSLIRRVASSFNDDQADVTFNGKVNIELTRRTMNALNLKDLQDAIEEIIPANLDYTLGLKYEAVAAIKSELLQNIPSDLIFCGEIKCGSYPEENAAKQYSAGIRLAAVYSTAEQAYKLCGTAISGDNIELTNDAMSYSGTVRMAVTYSTALQTYPVCGVLVCGEGVT